ncbi:unnamed protein product [Penicillium glandicola]
MTFTAIVMYPNDADIQFDESYYLTTHMPLVEKTWKSHGLISWRINKFPNAFDGTRSAYLIMATLEWESEESFKSALQSVSTAGVFADIPKFTNVKPVTLAGTDLTLLYNVRLMSVWVLELTYIHVMNR